MSDATASPEPPTTTAKFMVVVREPPTRVEDLFELEALRAMVPGLVGAVVNLVEEQEPEFEAKNRAEDVPFAVLTLWVAGTTAPDADGLAGMLPWPSWVYPVEARPQWTYERTWPLGQRSPGMKRLSFPYRVPEMTHEAFADHWANVHGPLVKEHNQWAWSYTQNVVSGAPSRGSPAISGIAEHTYRTADDYRGRLAYDSTAGGEILRADVAKFVAPGPSSAVWVSEYLLTE